MCINSSLGFPSRADSTAVQRSTHLTVGTRHTCTDTIENLCLIAWSHHPYQSFPVQVTEKRIMYFPMGRIASKVYTCMSIKFYVLAVARSNSHAI